jgi:hypothetical protein
MTLRSMSRVITGAADSMCGSCGLQPIAAARRIGR